MRVVRTLFSWFFLCVALLLLWSEYTVGQPALSATGSAEASLEHLWLPLAFVVVLLVAWWTVLRGEPSAARWAIAASCAIALIGFFLARDSSVPLVGLGWAIGAAGIAGLFVFLLGDSGKVKQRRFSRGPRPGDGTSKLVNRSISVAAALVAMITSALWWRWAEWHHLTHEFAHGFLFQLIVVVLLIVTVHEAGHAAAGIALRMKLIGAGLGPFVWWKAAGKWKFQFRSSGLQSILGYVQMVPTSMVDYRPRKIMQVAAGPVASIATGLLATLVTLGLPQTRWENDWLIFALFANISLLEGVFNLIPFGIGGRGYSDGAKLRQLISDGPWGEYQTLMGMVQSTSVTPLRPKQYNIEAIQLAAEALPESLEKAAMYLAAYAHFLDTRRLAEAADASSQAEQICLDGIDDVPVEWYTIFLFANAFLRRDPDAARAWWERFENQRRRKETEDWWVALAALRWSEYRLDEAKEAFEKAEAWVRQLPESGYAQAERNALDLLRQAFDRPMPVRATPAKPSATAAEEARTFAT